MPTANVSDRLRKRASRHVKERVIELLLFGGRAFSVFITAAIVYILVKESWIFFETVPLSDFLFDTQWTPLFDDAHYGIMVLLSGTLTSSAVALPWRFRWAPSSRIYLSEFAGFKVREIAKPFLELLGGVPTIVYGYFALVIMTPLLQKIYPDLPGFNLLSAGLVMGIMIIPYVASLSEDAMRATVPMSLREGSYAMGATRFQDRHPCSGTGRFFWNCFRLTSWGISRAVGETMILARGRVGMQPQPLSEPAGTRRPPSRLTSYRWLWATCRTAKRGVSNHFRGGIDLDVSHAHVQPAGLLAAA